MRSSTELYWRNRASAGGSRGQQLDAEVVGHEAVVTREARRSPRSASRLHRQRREVQAGGPALGPLGQLGPRSRPAALRRSSSSSASCSSRRRSATPISSTNPRARQRASGSAGTSRLAIAICEPAGRNPSSAARASRHDGIGDGMQIVEHEHQRRSSAASALPSAGRASTSVDPPGPDSASNTSDGSGSTRWIAAGDVAQEHHRVVVSRRRARPTRTDADRPRPTREQRRLAVPGGRDHGRERRAGRTQPREHVRLPPPCRVGSAAQRAWTVEEVERNLGNGHRRLRGARASLPGPSMVRAGLPRGCVLTGDFAAGST